VRHFTYFSAFFTLEQRLRPACDMRAMRRACICAILLFGAASFEAEADAASLTLAWDPPAEAADVAGYTVWYGTAPGVYVTRLDAGLATARKVDGLTAGITYYFAVQAYNAANESGELSEEIYATPVEPVPVTPPTGGSPAAPGGGPSGGGAPGGGTTSGGGDGGASNPSPPVSVDSAPVVTLRQNRFLEISWTSTAGVALFRVEVGHAPAHTAFSAVTPNTSIVFDGNHDPAAAYFVRVRPIVGGVPGEASQEAAAAGTMGTEPSPAYPIAAQCTESATPAREFVNAVRGNAVQLAWQPGGGPLPTMYVLEVGSRPGLQDLHTVPLSGSMTGLSATAGDGVYAARLVAVNDCGANVWAPESIVRVGEAMPAPSRPVPGQPASLVEHVAGDVVTLMWTAPLAVGEVTRYLIEAATPWGPFAYDTGNRGAVFTNANTPPGEYIVTVRAGNAAGFGPASSSVRFVVH
jgi:hypothetical protein